MKDSKGWDGKLRVERHAVLTNPEALEDPEYSDEDAPPAEEIEADEDLLEGVEDNIDVRKLPFFLVGAVLASTFCSSYYIDGTTLLTTEYKRKNLNPTLKELDLYDNLISHIKGLDQLTNLTSLDLSFNNIKHIKNISTLVNLTDLYFVQNRIQRIEGLEGLAKLRNLELGANRIRNISHLSNLKILSLPSNRLTSLSGLSGLTNLEELYVSHNAITHISGLESLANLHVLDISNNQISKLENISHLTHIEEVWASNNKLSSFEEVERELRDKEELKTVYFEGNPLQLKAPALYRNKVRLALPHIQQIDATSFEGFPGFYDCQLTPGIVLSQLVERIISRAPEFMTKLAEYGVSSSFNASPATSASYDDSCSAKSCAKPNGAQSLATYDYRPKAFNTGRSALAIFETTHAATTAVNASPITVSIPESIESPDNPLPIIQARDSEESTTAPSTPHITCTINHTQYDHTFIVSQNPYNRQFHLSKTWFEVQDLTQSKGPESVPMAQYADCFARRKNHVPARIQNIWLRESEKNGAMSLHDLWKNGLQNAGEEEAGGGGWKMKGRETKEAASAKGTRNTEAGDVEQVAGDFSESHEPKPKSWGQFTSKKQEEAAERLNSQGKKMGD
ncbi:protein phosphatases PP1 regulatory subunit sds22 [Uncinocarpus reesii 1704]|uniref:Protein phosphatases PP1 regulatory subunit sds22 n=1 Tax=Uncinocarpus reesii (strain UAMH 1704) TaxID=336963 RepID=C4JVP3_UNCRE|nr:protein phosphatases PP1 regulatory subunit sds22 [Uncinocarpus reesii 1704]EEP81770.1 protein phosphatases PP1 regulatory subunit sds22 [Uncinocarpus reesii 1704]